VIPLVQDSDSESSSSEDNSDSKNSQDAQCTSRVTTEVACQTEDRPPTGCSKHRYMEILERSKVVMLPHFYEALKSNLEARTCTPAHQYILPEYLLRRLGMKT
jgi:hypothetical protein